MTDLQKLVRRFSGGGQVATVRDAYPAWQGADYDCVSLAVAVSPTLIIRRIGAHGIAEVEERSPTEAELAHLTAWITAKLPERSWMRDEVVRIASKSVRDKMRADGDVADTFYTAKEPISEARLIAFLRLATAKGTISQIEMDGLLTDLRRAFDGD